MGSFGSSHRTLAFQLRHRLSLIYFACINSHAPYIDCFTHTECLFVQSCILIYSGRVHLYSTFFAADNCLSIFALLKVKHFKAFNFIGRPHELPATILGPIPGDNKWLIKSQ